ncbi:MAG: hypothetical protein LBR53_03250 [Deltaproteobacteria bacterium]|jgi:TPR repeat protein|nr:hypothetical protein [Deltaproteobacteria bacterium]
MTAVLGDEEGRCSAGFTLLGGVGVPVDYAEAFHWLRLTAEHGRIEVQADLGGMRRFGL